MKTRILLWSLVFPLALSFWLSGTAPTAHAAYTFTKVADTDTPIPGGIGNFAFFQGNGPALDQGVVVFIGFDSDRQTGVYQWVDGALSVVADTNTIVPGKSETFGGFGPWPSVDNGVIGVPGGVRISGVGRDVLATSSGGLLNVVAVGRETAVPGTGQVPPPTFAVLGSANLGDGDVAFFGRFSLGSSLAEGIYSTIGGTISVVADAQTQTPDGSGDFFFPLGFASTDPSIDGGAVAFNGRGPAGPSQQHGIYLWEWGILRVVADNNTLIPGNSEKFSSAIRASLNGGRIAFVGGGPSGQRGIYLDDGLSLGVVVDNNTEVPGHPGLFFTSFGGPALDDDALAFLGFFGAGDRGIFLVRNAMINTVVEVGDMLDGKEISSLSFLDDDALGGEEIAFRTTFLDGSQGIFIAAPTSDPADLIAQLIQSVEDLNLQRGIENSLKAKLNVAQKVLGDANPNNDSAAVNTLSAFIDELEAQRGKKIPVDAADALIADAQAIIDLLMGG